MALAKVKILPPEIISKIAAGEVIERPASVVKELVENSLDAGASSIEIRLADAGKTLIRVSDTGSGIEADDIEQLFTRHATSKIDTIEDLFAIQSLGFRGEALYSIAAIADVILRSATARQDTGREIHVRGGERKAFKPVSMQPGTDIEVKELFFNTPARRKFLRSDTTELHRCLQIITPYMLLANNCRFLVAHNDKTLHEIPAHDTPGQRISHALRLPGQNIIEVQKVFPDDAIAVHMFLGDSNIPRTNKDTQFIFVNSRPVQDRMLSFHLNQAYRLLFTESVYPFFAVFLSLPRDEVDVNVHPTKREVKLKNEQRITSLIRSLCERSLMTSSNPKQFTVPVSAPRDVDDKRTPSESQPQETTPEATAPLSEQQYIISFKDSAASMPEEIVTAETSHSLREKLSLSRYVGTCLRLYLLFETQTSLLIIDQHAAAERIAFEKLKRQVDSGRVEVQQLISPLLVRLVPEEMLLWESVRDTLETMGFAMTVWDKETVAIHAHPQIITDPEFAVRNIVAGDPTPSHDIDILARRACKQSITAGAMLSVQEAEYIRTNLLLCEVPFTCPHGRPTVIELPESVLLKQFLRT